MLSLKKFLKSENIVPTSVPVRNGNLITLTAVWCGEIAVHATLHEGNIEVRVQDGEFLLKQLPRRRHEVPLATAAKHFALYLGDKKGGLTPSLHLGAALYPDGGVEWASLSENERAAWLSPEPRLKWSRTTNRDEFLFVGQRDLEGRLVLQSEVVTPARCDPPGTKIECWYAVLA